MHRTLEVLLSDGEILKDSHKIYHLRLTHNQWGKEEVEIDFFLDPFSHQLGPLVPVVINFWVRVSLLGQILTGGANGQM